MTKESKITTSALANSEASRLINWLQLKMDYALTNEKSDVIFIDCNFVKRFISELRRLEKIPTEGDFRICEHGPGGIVNNTQFRIERLRWHFWSGEYSSEKQARELGMSGEAMSGKEVCEEVAITSQLLQARIAELESIFGVKHRGRYIVYKDSTLFRYMESLTEALEYACEIGGRVYEPLGMDAAIKIATIEPLQKRIAELEKINTQLQLDSESKSNTIKTLNTRIEDLLKEEIGLRILIDTNRKE